MSDTDQLLALRNTVVADMSSLGSELRDNQSAGLDTLLLIAHNTGNADLLQAAHQRIAAIEDPTARADAYLDLLDEIDYLMTRQEQGGQAGPEAPAVSIQPEEQQPQVQPESDNEQQSEGQ